MHKALLFSFILIANTCYSRINESTIRAVLLQKFADYIEWPKNALADSFSIGIVGQDTAIINNLQKLSQGKAIHKRPVKIRVFPNPDQVEPCNILFISTSENFRIEKYWGEIEHRPTLFVTEDLPNMLFSMINIEYRPETKTFSFVINKSNLMLANLQAQPDLLLVGGTEIDIRDLYKSTKKQLDTELEKVAEQKKLIALQLKKILAQNKGLAKQTEEMKKQIATINLHKDIINIQRNTLDSLGYTIRQKEDFIKKNKQLISTQQNIISQQKESVEQKETELSRLNGQLQYIASQIHKKQEILQAKDMQLEEKEFVISSQQQYLWYMLIGSAFILLALSFIVYAYRSKASANKILDEKNLMLEKHQKEIHKQSEELLAINNQINAQKDELEQTIDKLQETQSQLIQSEKMASLGTFTAGIAHEINNPINFITSGIEGIKTVVEPMTKFVNSILATAPSRPSRTILEMKDLIEGLQLMAENIETGANRATEIVKGLNEFSRSDDMVLIQTDIRKSIESTLLILNNEIKKRIAIEKYYEAIPPIYCYQNKINQVLLNIIGNATQAIEGKGTIRISTQPYGKDKIKLKIADSGKGIDSENIEHIFEPFYTTKEVGKGTGLGLAICYSIIEQHNGKISVKSAVNEGTEFTITLPINPNE